MAFGGARSETGYQGQHLSGHAPGLGGIWGPDENRGVPSRARWKNRGGNRAVDTGTPGKRPARTVATLSGSTECFKALAMPGRARPAAQPHMELITIITVPLPGFKISFTACGVRVSITPSRVNSSRIGPINSSGYLTTSSLINYFRVFTELKWQSLSGSLFLIQLLLKFNFSLGRLLLVQPDRFNDSGPSQRIQPFGKKDHSKGRPVPKTEKVERVLRIFPT